MDETKVLYDEENEYIYDSLVEFFVSPGKSEDDPKNLTLVLDFEYLSFLQDELFKQKKASINMEITPENKAQLSQEIIDEITKNIPNVINRPYGNVKYTGTIQDLKKCARIIESFINNGILKIDKDIIYNCSVHGKDEKYYDDLISFATKSDIKLITTFRKIHGVSPFVITDATMSKEIINRESLLSQVAKTYDISEKNIAAENLDRYATDTIEGYVKYKKHIQEIARNIMAVTKSPYERHLITLNLLQQYSYSFGPDETNYLTSRNITEILNNEGKAIVCVGYARLYQAIVTEMGIPCRTVATDEFGQNLEHGGHCKCIAYLKDAEYKTNGVYIVDPTWLSKPKNIFQKEIEDPENAEKYFNFERFANMNVNKVLQREKYKKELEKNQIIPVLPENLLDNNGEIVKTYFNVLNDVYNENELTDEQENLIDSDNFLKNFRANINSIKTLVSNTNPDLLKENIHLKYFSESNPKLKDLLVLYRKTEKPDENFINFILRFNIAQKIKLMRMTDKNKNNAKIKKIVEGYSKEYFLKKDIPLKDFPSIIYEQISKDYNMPLKKCNYLDLIIKLSENHISDLNKSELKFFKEIILNSIDVSNFDENKLDNIYTKKLYIELKEQNTPESIQAMKEIIMLNYTLEYYQYIAIVAMGKAEIAFEDYSIDKLTRLQRIIPSKNFYSLLNEIEPQHFKNLIQDSMKEIITTQAVSTYFELSDKKFIDNHADIVNVIKDSNIYPNDSEMSIEQKMLSDATLLSNDTYDDIQSCLEDFYSALGRLTYNPKFSGNKEDVKEFYSSSFIKDYSSAKSFKELCKNTEDIPLVTQEKAVNKVKEIMQQNPHLYNFLKQTPDALNYTETAK